MQAIEGKRLDGVLAADLPKARSSTSRRAALRRHGTLALSAVRRGRRDAFLRTERGVSDSRRVLYAGQWLSRVNYHSSRENVCAEGWSSTRVVAAHLGAAPSARCRRRS